jgi:hypothetical protein
MSASVKYTVGRVGLFVLLVALLWPLRLNLFVTLLLALLVSSVASFVVLRRWRTEMVGEIDGAVSRRRRRREDLRAALAGDERAERDAPERAGRDAPGREAPGDDPSGDATRHQD